MTDRKTIWLPAESELQVTVRGHAVYVADEMTFEQRKVGTPETGFGEKLPEPAIPHVHVSRP